MKIGRHLRKAREALELTQQDLAHEIKVTPQHISRIELGQAAPSVEALFKLSQILGVSTDYLLTGREIVPLDATGAIRSEPDISAAAKKHLIGLLNELRSERQNARSSLS
jgi:transcriptional regulator with XRE-family HTH domain